MLLDSAHTFGSPPAFHWKSQTEASPSIPSHHSLAARVSGDTRSQDAHTQRPAAPPALVLTELVFYQDL